MDDQVAGGGTVLRGSTRLHRLVRKALVVRHGRQLIMRVAKLQESIGMHAKLVGLSPLARALFSNGVDASQSTALGRKLEIILPHGCFAMHSDR
jgi:hypothetical protein